MFDAKDKKEKGLFHRSLTVILAVLITVSMMPAAAFAADDTSDGYVFDTFTEYSTFTSGDTLNDSFYFTEEWFNEDPAEINHSLALLSMQLSAAAVTDEAEGYGADMLSKLGFESVGFNGFGTEDPDDCAYTWAKKTLDDGTTLIAVAVQSFAFDSSTKAKGWKQNFLINGESAEGDHYALSKAADKALDDIAALSGGADAKYWITGHSRGGAIAGLIAAKLPDKLGSADKGIFAYTFEAPATAEAEDNGEQYSYIHNYICTNDPVPKVPMWGMTRYGTDFILNTEETDAGLIEELEKLGSGAAESDPMDTEEHVNSLIDTLQSRVSAAPDDSGTRADYSKIRKESFTASDGTQVEVEYAYQDTFTKLMGFVFGGGLSFDAVSEALPDLLPLVLTLREGVDTESKGNYYEAAPYYWDATTGLYTVLQSMAQEGELSLTNNDIFALLRLIGPMLIDNSAEPTGDPNTDAMTYISPVLGLFGEIGHITFPHHFDSVIARLKVLAPQPDLEAIDITINDPAAGDELSKAEGEIDGFISGMDHSWLESEAAWNTEDTSLEDGKIYYMNVTLSAVAHLIPEDHSFTINGKEPVSDPVISYEDGVSTVSAVFEFTVGEPDEVKVSFDSNGHGDTPEAITVQKGKALDLVDQPEFIEEISEGDKTWVFGGWIDEDGTPWEDIIAGEDITLYAKWLSVIDNVQVTFDIPSLGDDVPELKVPDDAPYYLVYTDDEFDYHNTYISYDWDPVTSIENEGSYDIFGYVSVKDGVFKLIQPDEEDPDYWEYGGILTVNGEECYASYEYGDGVQYLYFNYTFEVTADEPAEPQYKVYKGSGFTYVIGSGSDAEFIIKRTVDDSETFGHFTGIEMDGTAVDSSNYTAEEGSVVITLKADYLDTLDAGEHVLKVLFDDGSAEVKFTVTDGENEPGGRDDAGDTEEPEVKPGDADAEEKGDTTPKTGDETNIFIWIALMLASLGALGGTVFSAIRRRR